MRFVTTSILVFLACFITLHIIYPWSDSYGNYVAGLWETLISYLFVSAVIGIAAAFLCILKPRKNQSIYLHGIVMGLLFIVFSVVLAIMFGPVGINVPGTRVRGIFFAEFQFIDFIICVAGL